jgi:hypothetical protein
MISRETHITRLFEGTAAGEDGLEVELELDLAEAEPDVGIMGPYIDD